MKWFVFIKSHWQITTMHFFNVGMQERTGHYKKSLYIRILWLPGILHFPSNVEIENHLKMINWAIISAGANYGRGLPDMVNIWSTYLGASSTTRSFLRSIKPHADTTVSNIVTILSQHKKIKALYNKQRGHLKKFQRFGSSNRCAKVTSRTVRSCLLCEDNLGKENGKRVPITYINQKIINLVIFSAFEKEIHII